MRMERIIKHIERLLLLHDCVIIPDFGGFVLQSLPAVYKDEEHAFTPARKEIVFNPTLTHNDGLLIESYMQAYGTDYTTAQQSVRKDVTEIKELLDDYSELDMGEIGVILKEVDRFVFLPGKQSDELFSVPSYGLPVFHSLPLSARRSVTVAASGVTIPAVTSDWLSGEGESKKAEKTEVLRENVIYRIPVTRTFLHAVGVAAAAILLFLFISTPVGDVNKSSYTASFIPQEIMPKKTVDEIVSDAFAASDKVMLPSPDGSEYVKETDPKQTSAPADETEPVKPIAGSEITESAEVVPTVSATSATSDISAGTTSTTVKEASGNAAATKATSAKTTSTKAISSTTGNVKYYVIIGSLGTKALAQKYINEELRGTAEAATAQLLVRDGRVRVYAQHFMSEQSAQSYLNKIRQNPRYKQAWIYKGL